MFPIYVDSEATLKEVSDALARAGFELRITGTTATARKKPEAVSA